MKLVKKIFAVLLLISLTVSALTSCLDLQPKTVTFVLANGEEDITASTDVLSLVRPPEAPTKENYIFRGWYKDKECTKPFDFDSAVKSDITLYAGYSLDTEKILNAVSSDVMKANVKLSVVHYSRGSVAYYPMANSTGSGIIYKKSGNYYFLLTNNHVVKTADTAVEKTVVTVIDCYGNATEGEVMYSSAEYDLAVVRFLSEKQLDEIEISQRMPDENEPIIAIGSPKGQYNSVTVGNVKDFATVTLEDSKELSAVTFPVIWHTAKCDNGSSGGALLDVSLKIIGVNFATAEDSNGGFKFGFAVSGEKLLAFLREYDLSKSDA